MSRDSLVLVIVLFIVSVLGVLSVTAVLVAFPYDNPVGESQSLFSDPN